MAGDQAISPNSSNIATLPAIGELTEANLIPGGIVADDADEGQVKAHHGLEVPTGQ
jgi:hypothetical protein